jgi:hypothetical protein
MDAAFVAVYLSLGNVKLVLQEYVGYLKSATKARQKGMQ